MQCQLLICFKRYCMLACQRVVLSGSALQSCYPIRHHSPQSACVASVAYTLAAWYSLSVHANALVAFQLLDSMTVLSAAVSRCNAMSLQFAVFVGSCCVGWLQKQGQLPSGSYSGSLLVFHCIMSCSLEPVWTSTMRVALERFTAQISAGCAARN